MPPSECGYCKTPLEYSKNEHGFPILVYQGEKIDCCPCCGYSDFLSHHLINCSIDVWIDRYLDTKQDLTEVMKAWLETHDEFREEMYLFHGKDFVDESLR